ncbi:MAG: hypothetical protein ACMUHU_06215 [Thermoplasmatota archaeon]
MRKTLRTCEAKGRKALNILITLSFMAIGTVLSGCTSISESSSDPRYHDFKVDCHGLGSSVDDLGNVHTVWMEEVREYGKNHTKVYYSKTSMDGGIIVRPRLLLTGDPLGKNFDIPQCSVEADSKGGAHIVFGLNGDLHYAKVDDLGDVGWPRQITGGYDRSIDPDMAVDSMDRAHIVWTDWRYGESTILYLRMDPLGRPDSEVKLVGPGGSYNPSVVIDRWDSLYIAFYSEYGIYITHWWLFFWIEYAAIEVSHIVLLKSDLDLENPVLLDTGIRDFDWDTLEIMGLGEGPEGGVYLYWTSYDAMSYRWITPEVSLDRGLFVKNETFVNDANGGAVLEYTNYSYILDHRLVVEICKDEFLPKEGEILFSFDNGPYAALGRYSLPAMVRGNVSKRFTFDISDRVAGDGLLTVSLRDLGRTGPARIAGAEIIREVRLRKGEWQDPHAIHGTMVLRPSVANDRFGNLIVAWYQKEGDTRVLYTTVDSTGNQVNKGITVFSSPEEVRDVSVSASEWGEVSVVWTSRSKDDNYLRHAVFDRMGNSVVDPYPVSRNHREWETIDDLGGPWGLFFIIASPVAGIIITVTLGVILLKRRARKKALNAMVIDYSIPAPQELVTFEVIARRRIR